MNYSDFLSSASKVLRTSSIEIERIIITAPYRYKHYQITKRSGGQRDIHHPTPALKAVQRWITNEILVNLPVHDCVYSYRKGRNIAMHASQHAQSNYITRFDFSDFFPSISGAVVRKFLHKETERNTLNLDTKTIEAIVRLVCRSKKESSRLVLSIGAPSSPHISNAILYHFDSEMTALAERMSGTYTRYADDIYVSSRSQEVVRKLEEAFLYKAAKLLPFLRVNTQKTQQLSRKRRISVTGVNITSQRKLSIGREIKRSLKTKVYLALEGQLDREEFSALRGMLAHVSSVEPTFIDSLGKKFGAGRLSLLLASRDLDELSS